MIKKPCFQKFVYTLKYIVFKNIKLWKHGLFVSKINFKESFDVFNLPLYGGKWTPDSNRVGFENVAFFMCKSVE